MPRNNRIFLLLTYLPILLVVTFTFLMHIRTHRQAQVGRNSRHGRYSEQQILRLSLPMGAALAPESGELQFSSFPMLAQDRTGTKLRWKWMLEVSDTEGHFKGSLLWDADTGLVELASRHPHPSTPSSGRLTRAEAVEASLHWLVTLHMVEGKFWRLASEPELVSEQWQCRFLSPNARAFVSVAADDGRLMFARTYPGSFPQP